MVSLLDLFSRIVELTKDLDYCDHSGPIKLLFDSAYGKQK